MFNDQLPFDFFTLIPKVELHVHLDCSLSYEFVKSYRKDLTEESYRHEFKGPAKFTNLSQFLLFTQQQIELMQTEQQLRDALRDVIKQLKQDSIIYAEIRFAPFLHITKGLNAFEVTQILCDELLKLNEKWDISTGLILCTLRHYDVAKSIETAELAAHFLGKGVVGFDIAGDEAGFGLANHKEAFKKAHRSDVPVTAHAGEAKGALSVWETLSELKPQRIGHGVNSVQDETLLKKLQKEGIHLEVCPSTNIQVNVFPTYLSHPVDFLRKSGISISINTDTRTITGIDLTREYYKLNRAFGWTKEHYYFVNQQAIIHSFTDYETKKTLISQLDEGYKRLSGF
jgi:adenosine deaminase